MLAFDSENPLSTPRPIFHTTQKMYFLKREVKSSGLKGALQQNSDWHCRVNI
jgi:hypothetical protein